ncbi:MAG: universal stress protein [Planctomycetes bacterium]|nr:universal stress protein [Planctomycetota bacterium]
MFKQIFVPVDNSKYSDYCSEIGVTLAKKFRSKVVGGHVYAANLHHKRFKEMESGLPEQYRNEKELRKQREFHNSLIGRGLRMISDSYLDDLEKRCQQENLDFERNLQEGKNYIELVNQIQKNKYDLVVIGVRGLGEVCDRVIGSVCERVLRRINTDVLIVKNDRPIDGNVLVTVDGSEQSSRSVDIACKIAQKFDISIEALSVYDPHFHRVAFDGIAKVISGEMENVFKSEEQEELHDNVIDRGLEKIYHDHLQVAMEKTKDYGIDIKTTLLEGKSYDQILKYQDKLKPSLLILGRTGIHSSKGLDLGSAAENILRFTNCNVLITKNVMIDSENPFFEKMVEEKGLDRPSNSVSSKVGAISWNEDARSLISKVPTFVREMVMKEVETFASKNGKSEITKEVVEEAKAKWSNSMNMS